jgi:hypothetical protein
MIKGINGPEKTLFYRQKAGRLGKIHQDKT